MFTPLDTLNIHALYLHDTEFKLFLPLSIRKVELRTTRPPMAHLMASALDREQLKAASFRCTNDEELQTPFQFCSIAGSHLQHLRIILQLFSSEGTSTFYL